MCNGPPVCARLRFSSLRCNVEGRLPQETFSSIELKQLQGIVESGLFVLAMRAERGGGGPEAGRSGAGAKLERSRSWRRIPELAALKCGR